MSNDGFGYRFAYSLKEASHLLNVGRTSLYELAKTEQLKLIKIAGRTLVPHSEMVRLTHVPGRSDVANEREVSAFADRIQAAVDENHWMRQGFQEIYDVCLEKGGPSSKEKVMIITSVCDEVMSGWSDVMTGKVDE